MLTESAISIAPFNYFNESISRKIKEVSRGTDYREVSTQARAIGNIFTISVIGEIV